MLHLPAQALEHDHGGQLQVLRLGRDHWAHFVLHAQILRGQAHRDDHKLLQPGRIFAKSIL